MIVGTCGLVCSDCDHFKSERCLGCEPMNKNDPTYVDGPCRIWICAKGRGLDKCGLGCDDFPCSSYNLGMMICPWMVLSTDT
ncbi:MAG: DUF3795 domain-containing protein [Candidatus Hydrothermarchaeales archaeon]